MKRRRRRRSGDVSPNSASRETASDGVERERFISSLAISRGRVHS